MVNKEDKLKEKTLHIRGIRRGDIISYVRELGGIEGESLSSKNDPNRIHSSRTSEIKAHTLIGEKWICTVSSEEYFTFLQSRVPQVDVLFQAEKSEILDHIIRKFRLKTLRGGG